MENPKKKKKTSQNPEAKFQFELNSCSKAKDLRGAISLYDDAVLNNTHLNQHHFNALLYLCSNSVADQSLKTTALDYGFRAFRHMSALGVVPNEASVTAVARLAAAKGDAEYAFELVKGMGKYNNATPRLRTYDPALFCFCEMLDADKAYEVEEHMNGVGVSLEEAELAALLKVSARSGRADKVYEYLHKLRSCVRCVSESTAVVVEEWFCGAKASEVGEVEFDVGRVKEGVLRNGGGWHGQGWVGKGAWAVSRTSVGVDGHCCCCGEQLVCVDIDDVETEKFAGSVAGLAMEREVKANFSEFQAWLEKHDSYEAIVDGANVGLYKQNFADGGFSISQLDCVVKELYNQSGNKWPLVVLHNKRLRGLMENPSSRKLVEEWMNNGALYTTPNGSNDDWYWLFAAVKLRCLLVTNDEMRDHIFELIGSNFFNLWKERHQVHYTFIKGNLKLQMPPSYSLVIQESEKGYWHVPLAPGTSSESSICWLCITRPSGHDAVATVSNGVRIWNMKSVSTDIENDASSQRLLATLRDRFGSVNCVRWAKHGRFVASGSDDRAILIHERKPGSGTTEFGSGEPPDIENWKVAMTLRGHTADVVDLNWSPDDSALASGSLDNTIHIWNMSNGICTAVLRGHSSLLKGVAWDPIGSFIASQSDDKY